MATEFKQSAERRAAVRERVRNHRARKRAGAVSQSALPFKSADADELADWCRKTLVIPPGHPNAGQPMELPGYIVEFLRDAYTVHEALLCIARKNAKSAGVAAGIIARLAGPLRFSGYRGGVCSVNKDKAGELWMQIDAIVKASGLERQIQCMRSPRHIRSETGRVDILSADASAGHASGFDELYADELGLFKERDRELVNGLWTSVSAKNGRFIALSIQGDAPFTEEMLARAGAPGIAVHHYAAPDGCGLDDEAAWHAANPGLGVGIKSLDYMRRSAARALATPADASAFRAYDLNQPQPVDGAMLVNLEDWRACESDTVSDNQDGPFVLGVDLSSGYAMSACAAYWPATGRLESMAAFPDTPGLKERGEADGVGDLYRQMAQRGELIETPGRTVDVGLLLHTACSEWGFPGAVVGDRWRENDLLDALESGGVPPAALVSRGMGFKDGSEDVRLFQRAVVERRVSASPSLLLRHALSGARTMSDPAGNMKLAKASQGGRRARHKDDAAAAAMLAVAEGMRYIGGGQANGGPVAEPEVDPYGGLI